METYHEMETTYFAFDIDVKDIEIVDSEGHYLIDKNGNKYLDFTMGWCTGAMGWKNREVLDAIKNFDGPTYVSPKFSYRPWVELAHLIAEIAPGNLTKSFRATGGTEAVELALQAAMSYTGRNKFVAIEGAYHGNSIAALGLVSENELFNWKRIRPPLDKKCAEQLDELLRDQDVAAFIMEPVITNMNVLIPDQEFMDQMQDICRKYGTLIIMDEIATGFGRTGKMFATEHFNVAPDIMCLGKSITGGASGLGAAIMTEEVADEFQEKTFPYSTYGWHPLSTAAAIANIKYLRKNWKSIEENIHSLSEYFAQRLCDMNFKYKPEVNIMGLAISIRFDNEDYMKRLSEKALKKGLIITEEGTIYPALNLDIETARKGLDILESCL